MSAGSTLATLRRMANDIARNLEAMGHDKAVLATADHIDKFWDPRMKQQIFADDERFGTLTPIAAEAIDHLAGGAHPESQTRATKFNSAHEGGRSDAG
jgi:formate dehydrogenase subunit delta